jgi:hypothetical protein
MPFVTDVMNLLANNEEFRELVGKLADRMQVLIGIDVKWVVSFDNGELSMAATRRRTDGTYTVIKYIQ